jgi:hypothetical protein
MNSKQFNKKYLPQRILAAPFVLILIVISLIFHSALRFYLFLKYGGEMITFVENERPTIEKIYQELKKSHDQS